MKHEIAKILKVIDELCTYFMQHCHATSIDMKLQRLSNQFTVHLTIDGVHIAPEAYRNLQKKFSLPRSPELEDYYWQLTGEREDHSELNLVAMMCDSIIMDYQEPVLTLELIRRR